MQSRNQTIKELLSSTNVYSIPPYQRQYQWKSELWQSLINDVLKVQTSNEDSPPHWLGILLLSSEDEVMFPGNDSTNNYSVIDGQQRLVTLIIWLSALYYHAKDNNEEISFDIKDICKLSTQEVDKKPLEVVLENKWLDPRYSIYSETQILRAYNYFRFVLWLGEDALLEEQPVKIPRFMIPEPGEPIEDSWIKFLNSSSGSDLIKGKTVITNDLIKATRNRLKIITLIHEPKIDEPQAIVFDTLNGNRTPLEPLDHVRNSIFVRLGKEEAAKIYDKYWIPSENTLRSIKLSRQNPGINFLYDYVISKGEKKRQGTINKSKGANHFNWMTRYMKGTDFTEFIKNDVSVAMVCWPVAIGQKKEIIINGVESEIDEDVFESILTIKELTSGPANPLILNYLIAFINGKITKKDLLEFLLIIENYIVRQVLSNTPLSPLRSKIMELCASIEGKYDHQSLRNAMKKTGWISDSTILNGLDERKIYEEASPVAIGAIFRGIEEEMSGSGSNKFRVAKKLYTIEHIFPKKHQKWEKDMAKWKTNYNRVSKYIDTIGNLTVVTQKHNSTVGNKTLGEKQTFPNIFGNAAPLRIHEDWLEAKQWTEVEIKKRSQKLIKIALRHWKEF